MNIKTNNVIKILALGLILVVLPGGAWYYLQMGLNYQKDARSELKDFETYDLKQLYDNSLVNYDTIDSEEKLKLLCFLEKDYQSELLDKLYDQFGSSGGLEFVIVQQDQSATELEFSEYISYLNVKPEKYIGLKQDFGLPRFTKNDKGYTIVQEVNKTSNFKNKEYPYFILMDFENKIKNYYDSRDEMQVNRMVEHIAILIPKTGRKSKK